MPRGTTLLPSIASSPRLGAQKVRSPGAPSGTLNGAPGGGGGCSSRQRGSCAAALAGSSAAASTARARLVTARPQVADRRRVHAFEQFVERQAGQRLLLQQRVGRLLHDLPVAPQDR